MNQDQEAPTSTAPSGNGFKQRLKIIASKYKLNTRPAAFILAFALLGVITLGLTRAASIPLLSFEAEATTLNKGRIVNNGGASGGSMVRFATGGGSATVPSFKLSKPASKVVVTGYGEMCSGAPIVEIKVDKKSLGRLTISKTALSEYTLSKSISAGTHSLSVTFVNDSYQAGKCDRNVVLDKIILYGDDVPSAPAVAFLKPANGSTVSGAFTLEQRNCEASASDPDGIRKVDFYLNDSLLNTETGAPYNCKWDTASVPNGTYTLKAVATDTQGQTSSAQSAVTVSNGSTAPPTTPPPSGPVQGTLLFDGTKLANFGLIQSAAADRIQEVPDPLGTGKPALKFKVCDGDVSNGYQSGTCSAPTRSTPTENPRAQALSPDFLTEGTEYWLHDEMFFPADFPTNVPGWYSAITTAYGSPFNGSSPVSIVLDGTDIQMQRNSTYGYDTVWKMTRPKGKWVNITIHEKFSSSAGFVEMWVDGNQVTFSNGQKTLNMKTRDSSNNGSNNHAKIESYRQKGILTETTMYHRNFKVGTTKAIVEQ